MTNAEKSLSVMYAEVTVAADNVVAAINNGSTQKEIKALKKVLKSAVDVYNENLAKEYYRTLAAEHGKDAVKVALTRDEISVPNAIGVSIKVNDDDNTASYTVTKPIIRINLIDMQDAIGKEYFHNPTWFSRISALANLMAVALNKGLGDNPAFKYVVDEAAAEFKFDESANPTSKASMVKAFQAVIDDILWVGEIVNKKGVPVNDLKFEGRDWTFIEQCMTKEGTSTDDVVIGTPAKCTMLIAKCIHNIMTKRDADGNRAAYVLTVG